MRWHQILRPDGGGWADPTLWHRPDGVSFGFAGAWLTAAAGDTTVALEGTLLHPNAPASAWSTVATWTLDSDTPARTTGQSPLFIGAFRFLRWTVASTEAPPLGAALHLCIETQTQE